MATKKKKSEKRNVLYVSIILVGIFLLAIGIKAYEDVFANNIKPTDKGYVTVYIYTKRSYAENFESLETQGVFKNARALQRLIQLLGYEEMIRPGKYVFNEGTSNLKIIRALVRGYQTAFDITFKYAERTNDLASFWCKQLEADSLELIMDLEDAELDSLGLTPEQNIAIFIPNTYNFYWNTTSDLLIERMIKEYVKFWDSTRVNQAKHLNLSNGDVITLASIVQKETAKTDEMPTVAGVYYNRLKRGMLLQADPTVIYAMNDKSIRRVGGAMLQVESPYNTYKYKGLPPGPICIPHPKAVDAVLNMTKHDYIYFCAKEDFSGYHNFASNFNQHSANARKYQRALNARGVKLK